jgi:hypothetical protein
MFSLLFVYNAKIGDEAEFAYMGNNRNAIMHKLNAISLWRMKYDI